MANKNEDMVVDSGDKSDNFALNFFTVAPFWSKEFN